MTDVSIAYPILPDDYRLVTAARHWRRRSSTFATILARAVSLIVGLMEETRGQARPDVLATPAQRLSADLALRFQQTILPHMDACYNFARFLSRDADAAQDILQDAFLRAYRSFATYRGGDSRAWIFAIVRNCYLAWQQKGRRRARFETPLDESGADSEETLPHEIASQEDTAETAMIRESESDRVRRVISMLPDAMREVLVLREMEELSYRQIAEVIDSPIGTVMSRIARARREFAEAWAALGDGEVPA
ncbi:RNA polymerase subunit sigma-24 [Rhizobium sp. Root708]|nr:RNA polymerase subunit sigma-24 [Rhizobium sp. Root708]